MMIFEEIFTENFSKMTETNLINLANIFAKNHYAPIASNNDKPTYFEKLVSNFLKN